MVGGGFYCEGGAEALGGSILCTALTAVVSQRQSGPLFLSLEDSAILTHTR